MPRARSTPHALPTPHALGPTPLYACLYRPPSPGGVASPLKLLAPLLCAHVAPGGSLVLAGILERQADELKAAYAPWLAIEVDDLDDGWILMTGRRPEGQSA